MATQNWMRQPPRASPFLVEAHRSLEARLPGETPSSERGMATSLQPNEVLLREMRRDRADAID